MFVYEMKLNKNEIYCSKIIIVGTRALLEKITERILSRRISKDVKL